MQNAFTSETFPLLLILAGAVFVHACFQLSVSVLTRLSSHTIGAGRSQRRLLNLSLCYILGVLVATASVVLGVSAKLAWLSSLDSEIPTLIVVGLLPVIGLLVIGFYYRRRQGDSAVATSAVYRLSDESGEEDTFWSRSLNAWCRDGRRGAAFYSGTYRYSQPMDICLRPFLNMAYA